MRIIAVLFAFACSSSATKTTEPSPTDSNPPTSEVDPCWNVTDFPGCFQEAWCEAWDRCGFEEPCEETMPWLNSYESNNGTMSLDCTTLEPDYGACLALPESSSCDEIYDAAQLDAENGPWSDVCALYSCV